MNRLCSRVVTLQISDWREWTNWLFDSTLNSLLLIFQTARFSLHFNWNCCKLSTFKSRNLLKRSSVLKFPIRQLNASMFPAESLVPVWLFSEEFSALIISCGDENIFFDDEVEVTGKQIKTNSLIGQTRRNFRWRQSHLNLNADDDVYEANSPFG